MRWGWLVKWQHLRRVRHPGHVLKELYFKVLAFQSAGIEECATWVPKVDVPRKNASRTALMVLFYII